MKKLKYPYRAVCDFIKMKEEYKSLDKKSKKNYIIRNILKIVFFLLFIGLEIVLFLSLRIIENNFFIGFLAVFFMLIPIGCFILYVILSEYFVVDIKVLQKDLLYKINAPLYKYYNISDNKIITKCYDCSNNKYINQDINPPNATDGILDLSILKNIANPTLPTTTIIICNKTLFII